MPMFIVVLFTMSSYENNLRDQLKRSELRMWYIYPEEYYSAIKRWIVICNNVDGTRGGYAKGIKSGKKNTNTRWFHSYVEYRQRK